MRDGATVTMGYATQYFRHTVIQGAAAVAGGLLFYVLRIALYRNLSPEDYGLFYSAFSFGVVVYPFLSFGFDPGIVPYVTRFREEGQPGSIKQAVLGALVPQGILAGAFAILVFVFARPIATACLGAPQAAWVVRLVGMYAALTVAFKAGSGLLLGLQHVGARNLAELGRVAGCLVIAALMLSNGRGAEAAAFAYVVSLGLATVGEFVAVAVLNPDVVRARFRWRGELVAEIFRTGKYATIAFGGVTLFSNLDTVMLTMLDGDMRAVAAYQVALPTVTIVYSLMIAASSNFMPMVTTLWRRGERELLATGIERIYEAGLVVFIPATVLAACFSDVLMTALFRRDILNAPDAFNVLAPGSVFFFLCYLNLHILTGLGRPRDGCAAIAVALALNFVLNLALIPCFHIRGAALATVLSYMAATAISLWYLRKPLAIALPVRSACWVLLGSAVIALLAQGVRTLPAFDAHPIAVSLGTFCALYGIMIGVLEGMGAVRLRGLASMVLKRRVFSNSRCPNQQ